MDQVLSFRQISDYLHRSKIGVEQKMDDFFIYRFDQSDDDSFLALRAYRHHYYELSLEVSGGCSFRVDDHKLWARGSRVSAIAPGRLQSGFAHDGAEDSIGYSLFFSRSFLSAHLNERRLWADYHFLNGRHSPATYLADKGLAELQSLFALTHYEYHEYGQRSNDVLKAYTQAILGKVRGYYPTIEQSQGYSRNKEIAMQFEELCQVHAHEHSTVAAYADIMNISPKHLSDAVKKATGKRALSLINAARATEAKVLLIETTLPLAEIAFQLNFASTDYFISFFKQQTGTTPLKFRLSQS